MVKQILLSEGFKDLSLLQSKKAGQIFGLVKKASDVLEVHVRGYVDNTLDSEIEISREFVQHLISRSKPYYSLLLDILKRHGIPFKVERRLPPDPRLMKVPKFLVKWKTLLEFLVMTVFLNLIMRI